MDIEGVVSALQGFSGAYSTLASNLGPDVQHRLRVVAVEKESADLIILAWIILGQTPNPLQALELVNASAQWIVGSIAQLIRAKKHVKNQPYTVSVAGKNNNVGIINAQNVRFDLPAQLLPYFEKKLIDADLSKMARPLQKDKVTKLELRSGEKKDQVEAEIESGEREYFISESVESLTVKEASIDGMLESYNKETNRGTFRLAGGAGVPYRYTGENTSQFLADFGYPGLVKANCTATFDSNLQPLRLDIKFIERVHRILPLS